MGTPKKIEQIELGQLISWLGSLGFIPCQGELEHLRFEKLYDDFQYKLLDIDLDPYAIINNTFPRQETERLSFSPKDKEEFHELRMVARKGQKDTPEDIINKMKSKHKKRDGQ